MNPILRQNAINDLAKIYAELLPYSSNPEWKNHVSVQTICVKMQVSFWQPGSKVPGLRNLFQNQLNADARVFQKLLVELLKEGLGYRAKKENPVSPLELDHINDAIERLGFKIPELWDAGLRQQLADDKFGDSQSRIQKMAQQLDIEMFSSSNRSTSLSS